MRVKIAPPLQVVILLSLSLTACGIISYSPEPDEFPLAAKRDGLIRFYFHSGAVQNPNATNNPLPREAAIIQETLERKVGFPAAILSPTPATQGLHINAYITNKAPSPSSKFFCTLSLFTLTVLPCFSDTEGYLAQYDILTDQQLKKSYRFPIIKTQVVWIGLLPLSWINAFTGTQAEAFEASLQEFIKAAQADGLLPPLAAEAEGLLCKQFAGTAADMTRHSPFKRWIVWIAPILIPFLSACFASSWPASAPTPDFVQETLTPISLYIPEYLKNDRPPSQYLFHPPPGMVTSQFVTRANNQGQALGFRLISAPSDKGTFCTLHFRAFEPTTAAQLSSLLSILTYFLIPTYNGSMTFELTYDVFLDTHFVRQYRYQVQGKRLIWLFMPFALPFMPGHWEPTIQPQLEIPGNLMQGLLSTLVQLRAEGQRDGLFK